MSGCPVDHRFFSFNNYPLVYGSFLFCALFPCFLFFLYLGCCSKNDSIIGLINKLVYDIESTNPVSIPNHNQKDKLNEKKRKDEKVSTQESKKRTKIVEEGISQRLRKKVSAK